MAITISIGWSNFWPRERWEPRGGERRVAPLPSRERIDDLTNIDKTFVVGNSIFAAIERLSSRLNTDPLADELNELNRLPGSSIRRLAAAVLDECWMNRTSCLSATLPDSEQPHHGVISN
jgi:hypothetical protein